MFSLEIVCSAFLSLLEEKQSKTMFELWFKDLKMESLTESAAVFSINSNFKKSFLETKYKDLIASTLVEVVGYKPDVSIISTEDGESIPQDLYKTVELAPAEKEEEKEDEEKK